MCAIFGLGFMKGHKVTETEMVRDIVRKLFVENQVRGRTAAGLAFINSANIHVVKHDVAGAMLKDLRAYKEAEQQYMTFQTVPAGDRAIKIAKEPPISFIGHCRLKTKGSELDNVNNHPIIREEVVGVHNGMIGNDDRLFDIYSKAFKRNGRVDSEIIFALIEHFAKSPMNSIHSAIQKAAHAMTGSMACALVHRAYPHMLWIYRRGYPCSIRIFRDVGMIAWASIDHYITAATEDFTTTLGTSEEIKLADRQGISIDLRRNIMYRFSIPEYRGQSNIMSAMSAI